jgi:hypothetical protein
MKGILSAVLIAALSVVLWTGIRLFKVYGTGNYDWLAQHPVPRAVKAGDAHALARILTSTTRAEIDAPDDEGVAAIHLAARHGYLEMVKMLLDKGATQSTSRFGTPLDFAVRTEHLDVAALLIERGGQPSEIEVVARILWWKPELIDGFTLDAVTTEGAILYVIVGQAGRHDSLALAHLSHFPFDPDAVPRRSRNVEPVDRTLLGYAIDQFRAPTAENPDERKRAMQNLRWLLANKADPNHAVESKTGRMPLRVLLMGRLRDWGAAEDTFMVIGDLLARGAHVDDRVERPSQPEDACSTPALFLSSFRFAVLLAFDKTRRGDPPRPPTSEDLERLGAGASTSVVDGFLALLERFEAKGGKIIALDSCPHPFHDSPSSETLSQLESFLPARHRVRYRSLIDSMR